MPVTAKIYKSTTTDRTAEMTLLDHRDLHGVFALHAAAHPAAGRALRLTEDILEAVLERITEAMQVRGIPVRRLPAPGKSEPKPSLPDPTSTYPRLLPAYLKLVQTLLDRVRQGEKLDYVWRM